MKKTEAFKAMGTAAQNHQWSWHSTHKVSGAVVLHSWKHKNWERVVDGKVYCVATYARDSHPGRHGHLPRFEAVCSGAPLFCIYTYPTKATAREMNRYRPGTTPSEFKPVTSHVGAFVYQLDRTDAVFDERGNLWIRVLPGFLTHQAFNRIQSTKE